jgi:putative endonuclease
MNTPASSRTSARHHKGKTSYHAGIAAEENVERSYIRRNYKLIARRWRGCGGEIDLIVQQCDAFVFVEVKKSSSFAQAALRITPAQKARILSAASEFVSTQPMGLLSEMRFDAALVDAAGRVEIIENALWDG